MRIQIGDEVIPRNLGPPGKGVVFGLIKAKMWASLYAARKLDYWYEKYPNWRDGYVAYVLFKKPQKPYSYEEFLTFLNDADSIPEYELRTLYKYNVQYTAVSTYPVVDLDIVED